MPAIVDTGPVIGHRGAAGVAPENTLAGLLKARALGCRWVEVDAKLTADGVAVLFHDETLDRTTDARGAMAKASIEAVRGLDAGRWFSPRFKGERVPTLVEALAIADDLGLGVNVEIKPCPGRAEETADVVLGVLSDASRPALLVSSFDWPTIARACDVCPDLPRALLARADNLDRVVATARDLGCEGIHVPEAAVTAALVAHAHEAALAVRAFTVNCPVRAGALRSLGANAVFSDFPDRLRR